ncbi:MAG: CHAD domain-containing protein, partial [Ornithinimicrobium sp.]
LAAHLGPARDTEVMRARLEHIARTEGSQGQAARWARARARALGQEYRTHHRDAVRAMDTERYDALLRDLLEVATELTQTAIGGQPAGQELPGHVSRAYRALKHSIDAIERSAAAEADRSIRDERLHEARKKAKRARYAAEALVPAFGEPALELARAIEQVQADLGEHQDTVVLREWLRGEAQGAGAAEAFALGRWYAGEEQRGQLAEERFAHSWQVARKKKLRRWLR